MIFGFLSYKWLGLLVSYLFFGVAYARVSSSASITGFGLLLVSTTILSSQQTQSTAPPAGQPAQPSSSVYGRMRRVGPTQAQRQTTQAQQFPSPAQQFPPDQAAPASTGQRPPMSFPHASAPPDQAA